MQFADLGLHPYLLQALASFDFHEATAVQETAIPQAIAGEDLLVSSHTGSGKTLAFILPILQRLADAHAGTGPLTRAAKTKAPFALVLAPTRELALQVEKVARDLSDKKHPVRTVSLVGGAPFTPQLRAMSQGLDLIVATPGRLIDHMDRGTLDLSQVATLVLDEADRMLDMGFIEDIERIIANLSPERQTLLFSATLDGVVGQLAKQVTRNPQRVAMARNAAGNNDGAPEQIEQKLYFADNISHKVKLLDHFLRDAAVEQAVVFAATRRQVEELVDQLQDEGFSVDGLHGDMQQNARNRTLQRVRTGRIKILVATDVAARGLDVATISHVINFDLPRQTEDYVHRIGRTGRAGRSGIAISMASGMQRGLVKAIEQYTKQKMFVDVVPGLEPKPRDASKPNSRGMGYAKPSTRGAGSSDRPYQRRDAPATPRSGGERTERTYGAPKFGESRAAEKTYGDKPFGDKKYPAKPFGEKKFGESKFGDAKTGDKKFGAKPYGEKKFGDKPFGEKKFGDKKFGEPRVGESKFGDKPYGDKKFGDKKFGAKPYGDKKFGDKPVGESKFGESKFGERKFGDRAEKVTREAFAYPARTPRSDAPPATRFVPRGDAPPATERAPRSGATIAVREGAGEKQLARRPVRPGSPFARPVVKPAGWAATKPPARSAPKRKAV
jgi:superfamily II DNA/RNA helicase